MRVAGDFITSYFDFKEDGYIYVFQCYQGYGNKIDIIKYQDGKNGYEAALHTINDGKIMWNSSSEYVSEKAKHFGNRIAKLLIFS